MFFSQLPAFLANPRGGRRSGDENKIPLKKSKNNHITARKTVLSRDHVETNKFSEKKILTHMCKNRVKRVNVSLTCQQPGWDHPKVSPPPG
jgi:hypothetical protein